LLAIRTVCLANLPDSWRRKVNPALTRFSQVRVLIIEGRAMWHTNLALVRLVLASIWVE